MFVAFFLLILSSFVCVYHTMLVCVERGQTIGVKTKKQKNMKRFLVCCVMVAVATLSWSQSKFWIIKNDNTRQAVEINEVEEFGMKLATMSIRKKDGTQTVWSYKNIKEISFEDPGKEIYIPYEFRNMDFTSNSSRWCWERSRQSENFIVFWEAGFGADPTTAPSPYTVNIDDLLAKAETFFAYYADSLGFVTRGQSNTDKYKMEIYLYYQTEWLATGSGYDDFIGALWVNPSTCQPVGHTIAHEIGHSFQYQTSCDMGMTHGWRYGFGEDASGGNCYWESCAQWQGFKLYPQQQFTDYRFPNYCRSTHYNPIHEEPRYDLFFDQDYWCYLHGKDFLGRLWRESVKPEDPIEAYERLTQIDQQTLNDQMYDRAARFATWDIPALREYGRKYHGAQAVTLSAVDGKVGTWQIDSARCIQNYGYNLIRLNVPEAGVEAKAKFKGIAGAKGYRAIRTSDAGWRYGLVALTKTGERVYGTMQNDAEGTASLVIPEGCEKLWLVVSGAPKQHWRHAWDDNVANDEQWPYQVTFESTNPYGEFTFPADYQCSNITLTYDVELPHDPSGYGYTAFMIPDISPVCNALGLSASELRNKLGNDIQFVGVNRTGTLVTTSNTSNGCGHWFSALGNVVDYGGSSYIYSEYQKNSFTFHIGQYPGRCAVGTKYTISEGFRYKASDSKYYLVKFKFNVTII